MENRLTRWGLRAAVLLSVLWGTALYQLNTSPESPFAYDPMTAWQQSSIRGDSEYYLAQVTDFGDSIAPYRYRIIPTLLVRGWMATFGGAPEWAYVNVNTLCALAAGMLFAAYLRKLWRASESAALLGAVLLITTVSLQGTLLIPSVEPASYVVGVLLVWTMHARYTLAFVGVSIAAVLTKEVFIAAAPAWVLLWGVDHAETLLEPVRAAVRRRTRTRIRAGASSVWLTRFRRELRSEPRGGGTAR